MGISPKVASAAADAAALTSRKSGQATSPVVPPAAEEAPPASAPRTLAAAIAERRRAALSAAPALTARDAELAGDLKDHVASQRGDIRWQTFLNTNAAGTEVAPHLALGAGAELAPAFNHTTVGVPDVATGSITRATASATIDVPGTGGQALGASADPYTRGIAYTATLGHASVGGGAYAGRNIKGVNVSAGGNLAGAVVGGGVAATLVSRSALLPLEAFNPDTSRGIEILTSAKTEVLPVISVNLQGGEAFVGGGLRLVGMRGKAIEHQRWMPVEAVGGELRRRDRWWQGLKETGEALGVITGLGLPKAKNVGAQLAAEGASASHLRVGETLTWVNTRGLIFGLSAGGMGARANLTASLSGDHKMVLTRPSETVMELEVANTRAGALSFGADLPVLAEAFQTFSTGLASRRIYRFDLTEKAARTALGAALSGRMPGELPLPTHVDDATGDRLMGLVAKERLPAGVSHLLLEAAEARESARGVAGLKSILFTDKLDALAFEKGRGEGTRAVATPEEARLEVHHHSRKHLELLRLNKEHQVQATAQWRPERGPDGQRTSTLLGVRAEAVFHHERTSAGAIRQLESKLARHLGESLPATLTRQAAPPAAGGTWARWRAKAAVRAHAAAGPKPAGAFKVAVSRTFDPEALRAIAAAAPAAVADAAEKSDLAPARLAKLVAAMGATDEGGQATLVTRFIAEARSRGIGALGRLAGKEAPAAEIAVDHGAVDEVVAAVRDLDLRLIGLEGKRAVARELRRIDALEAKIVAAMDAHNGNHILRSLDEEAFVLGFEELMDMRETVKLARDMLTRGSVAAAAEGV